MTAKQERTYHVPEQPVPTTVKRAAYGYRCSSCGATGDWASNQWLYGPKSPLTAFMFCRSCVTISDIYDVLPMTEKTLLKRKNGYSPALRLRNDTGRSGDYRVTVGDRELGIVIYATGRKLTCHGIKQPYSKDGRHLLDVARGGEEQYDTREGCQQQMCWCHAEPQQEGFTCDHCGCIVLCAEY